MSEEIRNRAIEDLKSKLPVGSTIYSVNYGDFYTPKLALFYVDENRTICRITAIVSNICGLKFNDQGFIHKFNPGYKPILYVAEKLAEHLGYHRDAFKAEEL